MTHLCAIAFMCHVTLFIMPHKNLFLFFLFITLTSTRFIINELFTNDSLVTFLHTIVNFWKNRSSEFLVRQ